MFDVSRPFLFFEYFRVPHRGSLPGQRSLPMLDSSHPLNRCGQIWSPRADEPSAVMYWTPSAEHGDVALPPGRYSLQSIPIFCSVIPDRVARSWFNGTDSAWTPTLPVTDVSGAQVASIWRDERGSIFLPFDPAEAMQNCWSEAYQLLGGVSAAVRASFLFINRSSIGTHRMPLR